MIASMGCPVAVRKRLSGPYSLVEENGRIFPLVNKRRPCAEKDKKNIPYAFTLIIVAVGFTFFRKSKYCFSRLFTLIPIR